MTPVVLYGESSGFGDGDPVVAVPGSGDAVPRGVEANFLYNGLTMNDLTVIDKYRVISIDGLDDADVRDNREDNPSDDGETAYNAYYGGRTLAVTGRIEAYTLTKLRDMQMALRTAFNSLQEEPFYFLTGDPYTDHFINVRKFSKNQWSEEQKHLNHFFRDFLVTVRASDPRFYRYIENNVEIDPDTDSGAELTNIGNYNTTPRFIISGPMSAIEFYIEQGDDVQMFKLKENITIADGDFYEVNIKDKTLIANDGTNKFNDLDPTSDWVKMPAGDSSLLIPNDKCVTGGVNAKINWYWRDAWI